MRRLDYENMYKWVESKPALFSALGVIDKVGVLLTVCSYAFMLVASFVGGGWQSALRYLLFSAVPFAVLTVVRRLINAKRPAEVFGLADACGKRGESMPSRHVFSAFLIGTLLTAEWAILGALVLLIGVSIGACRVLRAKHFVRDCVAGALAGAITGIIGVILITV